MNTPKVLINNAAHVYPRYTPYPSLPSIDAFFGTKYLSHFLFTSLLHPSFSLPRSPRIVNVASLNHWGSPVRFKDVGFQRGGYGVVEAYGQSKSAQMLWSVEVGKKWKEIGATSFSLHPGGEHSLPFLMW